MPVRIVLVSLGPEVRQMTDRPKKQHRAFQKDSQVGWRTPNSSAFKVDIHTVHQVIDFTANF